MNLTADDLAHVAWFDQDEVAALRRTLAAQRRPTTALQGALLELDVAPVRELLHPRSHRVVRSSLAQPTAAEFRFSAQELDALTRLDLPANTRRSLTLAGVLS